MLESASLLRVQYAVGRALANASSLAEAAPAVLREVCEGLRWDIGVLWRVDTVTGSLKFVAFHSGAGLRTGDFEAECRSRTFAPGIGLPGRVWKDGKTAWIADVTKDTNFPRAPFAQEPGLHAAFGFPVRVSGSVVAVMEFFRRDVEPPDEELMHAMEGVGGQVGQYEARRRAESELAEAHVRLARLRDMRLVARPGSAAFRRSLAAALESGRDAERLERAAALIAVSQSWDVAVGWRADRAGGLLRFASFWSAPGVDAAEFETACRNLSFPKGLGLPGRVWQDSAPAWIPDLDSDTNFPRILFARHSGLLSAAAVPLFRDGDVSAVLEFFSRRRRRGCDRCARAVEAALASVAREKSKPPKVAPGPRRTPRKS